MPPIPAHKMSWQGTPVMVDIHGQQQPRMRLQSHTNEYMGMLRSKVAARMQGATPKRVRLFKAGEVVRHFAQPTPVLPAQRRASEVLALCMLVCRLLKGNPS
jgi:hypothetical protein